MRKSKVYGRVFRSVLVCGALWALWGVRAELPSPRVEPRIAGLEHNKEYMGLLSEDAALREREDSILQVVGELRRQLRETPDEQPRFSQEILELEGRLFDLRNAQGRLVDRINAIEQEWVLANLDAGTPGAPTTAPGLPGTEVPDSLKVRNLVDNLCFRRQLPESDYAALQQAQRLERRAEACRNLYVSNYGRLRDLAAAYAAVDNEAEAVTIHARCDSLQWVNQALSDSLSAMWNYIFDNKNYAYGYVLDGLGAEAVLSRQEEELSKTVRQVASLRGETASDALTDYELRRRMLVTYEAAVADLLTLDAARDSLRGVAARLNGDETYRLPRIVVPERYFLDFDSVAFSSTPKYTTQHPIPECRVYAKGTIYRILLGRFNTKRAAATFRGAYPLSYLIDDEKKWCYYAGGFATLAEAEATQARLKEHGFVRPEIVVWSDGVMRNLSRDPEAGSMAFRVEITGTEALSEEVKAAIAGVAAGRELSRVGQRLFVVGTFDDRAVAERLADAVREADTSLTVEVAEVGQ